MTHPALQVLNANLTRQLEASLHACAHCGLCTDACHYYVSMGEPKTAPAYKCDRLRRVWSRQHDWMGRILPWFVGARELDETVLAELEDAAFGTCTMCGRCMQNCPFGVDTRLIIRTARSMLTAIGRTPRGLKETLQVHLKTKNNMGVSTQEFCDTIEWLDEQVRSDIGAPGPVIPIDKKGARVMYLVNPREIKFYPLSLMAAAKIMYAAGEDWTMNTEYWDVTNYGLFAGDRAAATQIGRWAFEAATNLGVEQVWMSECGHGYRSLRWEAENWLGHPFPFRVRSLVEVLAEYVRDGRVRLDPKVNTKPITYHDPCNQARMGGLTEEPRYVLSKAAMDFRDMLPNRQNNYCCGGGGGMLAMSKFAPRRIQAARVKAEQIRATGAKIVATSCHNCFDQLDEVSSHYQLDVSVRTLSEIVADALVMRRI